MMQIFFWVLFFFIAPSHSMKQLVERKAITTIIKYEAPIVQNFFKTTIPKRQVVTGSEPAIFMSFAAIAGTITAPISVPTSFAIFGTCTGAYICKRIWDHKHKNNML